MSKELYSTIGKELTNQFSSSAGQMFGKPCLKTATNKAFAVLFKDEMVFKLGQQEITFLKDKYPKAINWDPSGKNRPMKDWLQVPTEFKDDWRSLAKQAFDYVENNTKSI